MSPLATSLLSDGLNVELTFDSGNHWQEAEKVTGRGDGVFEGQVQHPRLGEAAGKVSLRAEAWDNGATA